MKNRFSKSAMGVIALLLMRSLIANSDDDGITEAARSDRDDLSAAMTEYCLADAKETAQYLLEQGTPDDVALMEEAVFMFETGEWAVQAQMLTEPAHQGADLPRFQVRCLWITPFEELNGEYDVELEIRGQLETGRPDLHRVLPGDD